jgi:hypothetical protein
VRPTILEAKVLSAVDATRSGASPEDDFTECKATWPEPGKARQLAALANKAAGEPVIYIIGVDGETGAVTNPGNLDPADWWPTLEKRFDEVAPEVLRHMSVCVGDGEYVHAYAFDTSRAPYVIVNSDGSREVPMRSATGTRSAKRRELLRLLLPSVRVPEATMLSGSLSASWRAASDAESSTGGKPRPQPERAWLGGNAWCFVEHLGADYLMLPSHGMRGRVHVADWRADLEVTTQPQSKDGARPLSPHGIEVRSDGVLVFGPGQFQIWLQASIPVKGKELFASAHEVRLSLEFDVVGSSRPVRVDGRLARIARSAGPSDAEYLQTLGRFAFPVKPTEPG